MYFYMGIFNTNNNKRSACDMDLNNEEMYS